MALESIRAFLALEFDEPMRVRLAEALARLKPEIARVRWLSPETIHLTLRFLGPSSSPALERLSARVEPAARACGPCEAPVRGVGFFPSHGPPNVIWIGIDLPPPVIALQAQCERAAVEAGFAPEGRPFRPHVTLGRWRERVRRPAAPAVDLGVTRLGPVVLFKSDLRPQGAVHTPLRAFPLG
jgi:RNA 2',3'-cyclic 3'-phosphodiesterase